MPIVLPVIRYQPKSIDDKVVDILFANIARIHDLMKFSRRAFFRISGAAAVAPLLPGLATGKDSTATAFCHKLRSDVMRPQFHLLPASNWMNDPNGPIFFHGRYHMFHQYNPQEAVWGNMNWAHATSPDMVHWEHAPIALSPTPGGFDQYGVFSGSAVLDGQGRLAMIYTGVMPPASKAEITLSDGTHNWREVQCMAFSEDSELRVWRKLPEPVISAPPAGMAVSGFRDPFVWREDDSWMLGLGSGFRDKGGAILLYRSPDLRHWTYLHPLVEGPGNGRKSVNAVDTGEMWECPDFFPLGDKHVLLISTMGKVLWKVGTYKDQRFSPEREGVVDWGAYYAAKTMLDRDGNRILWGWIPETRPELEYRAAGWAGVMALPRMVTLNAKQELQMGVAPTVQTLRGAHHYVSSQTDAATRRRTLDNLRIHDLAAELNLQGRLKLDRGFALNLQTETGKIFATIRCSAKSGGRELHVNNLKAAFPGDPELPVHLQIFLDGSVMEVFANGATVITARVYQIPSSPLCLRLEGEAELMDLQVWQVHPISKDRLTSSLCD
jgi:beta-fructofuranosidase